MESPGEVFANDDSVVSGDTTADSVRVHVRCVRLHSYFLVTYQRILTGIFSGCGLSNVLKAR